MKNKTNKFILKYSLCAFIVLFVILFIKNEKKIMGNNVIENDSMLNNVVYASILDLRAENQNNNQISTDKTLNKEKQYNENDEKAYQIVNSSGMWTKEVNLMLPQMTSDGVERIVSVYMKRNGGNKFALENTKNTFEYINNTVDKDILKNDSKKYYDLVADEWYKRTNDIYLVMMLFPNMSTQKVDELVFSNTNETKEFFCVYKSLEYISCDGMDKIIFNYVELTNDYGTVIAAVDCMTKEGQKKFLELCPYEISSVLGTKEQSNEVTENRLNQLVVEPVLTQEEYSKFNDSDKQAYMIIDYCGMWNEEINGLLPNMSSYGIEKTVSLYMFKTRNFNVSKKVFEYINNTVDKGILKNDSKRYYDLVADEWYKRTNDIYLVMMLFPNMSTKKVDELVFSNTDESKDFSCVYKSLEYISREGMDKIIFNYVKQTKDYGTVIAAVEYMTKEGQKEFLELCSSEISTLLGIQTQNNEFNESSQINCWEPVLTQEEYSKFNDSDKQAYMIIDYCGMWNDEMSVLLPNMSSYGIEKTVSLYMFKTRNFNIAKKAFRYIENTVDKDILENNSKEYFDLVADEWYNRTKNMYLVMMIVPDMSTEKVDELIFDYIKETSNLQSLYSIINFMSEAGVDNAVLHYVEVTGNYDIALATIDYMSEDGRNKFMALYKNIIMLK